ncbi:hypothetical protein BYT27DRAFT_6689167 [Phlegmacium glaucopus]|nr:hypothetical protein BYT27DRAFT_6689167 [Phlegmacium glaucopus]
MSSEFMINALLYAFRVFGCFFCCPLLFSPMMSPDSLSIEIAILPVLLIKKAYLSLSHMNSLAISGAALVHSLSFHLYISKSYFLTHTRTFVLTSLSHSISHISRYYPPPLSLFLLCLSSSSSHPIIQVHLLLSSTHANASNPPSRCIASLPQPPLVCIRFFFYYCRLRRWVLRWKLEKNYTIYILHMYDLTGLFFYLR